MSTTTELLDELRTLIASHARADGGSTIDGLFLSRVETVEPHHSLTEPLLVVMAQGGKRLLLGDEVHEYRAGQYLMVTTDLPVSGHFLDAGPGHPALGLGLALRPGAIAPLLLEGTAPRRTRGAAVPPALATGEAGHELLDAATRLVRLLDHPADAPVLAPLIEREILWRLLSGPHGGMIRQIGLPDSNLTHINRAVQWIRDNYAEPLRIDDLARLAGMSASAFHRHFRTITATSPLQFQKRIRLQEARSLLLAQPNDVAGAGHLVGYDSQSQFTREYRRLFGAPPGRDAARLYAAAGPAEGRRLP
ncbi:AraC family transcriptional regulator [Streptomyces camponoticapitis]|uniref:AraC family transcriptional regulator n=1 Tax=Streptomyces camponoticapitis TaxID=1616125 RepID=A0ABQ2E315_9ACTN|nr:AraC family transcriptional regulator [Streptomyces camponoticapitis]GGJ91721.1 AraC family transcriptional regulator [Streptomyces camponoticapitis]